MQVSNLILELVVKHNGFHLSGKNVQTRNASKDSLFTHCMQGTFETTEHVMYCIANATVQIMIFICKKCLLLAIWLLVYTYDVYICIIIRCYLCVLEKLKMGESNSLQSRSKLNNWWGADIPIFMFTHHKNN